MPSAETVSPPPATLTSAPAVVWAATALATFMVAWSKGVNSNAPRGPFQISVSACSIISTTACALLGPKSNIILSDGTAVAGTTILLSPSSIASATTTSLGSIMRHPWRSALAKISNAVGARSGSAKLCPTSTPLACRNVLAIPPPITRVSTFSIKLLSKSSFVLILDPPTMATTGRIGWPNTLCSASNSSAISKPAKLGK